MENFEKSMTGEESLRIISEMINKTKVNIKQGSFHLLLWGWLILVCSLADPLLALFTDYPHPYYVWLLTIPGAVVSIVYGIVSGRKAKVHTYADRIYMWVWLAFFASFITLLTIHSGSMGTISSYILILAGFATFVSGWIIRFKPLIIGGVLYWIVAVASHFSDPSLAPFGMPLAVITGYLIPGYMLKYRLNNDKI
jgi:uncharacterized membrane protein